MPVVGSWETIQGSNITILKPPPAIFLEDLEGENFSLSQPKGNYPSP